MSVRVYIVVLGFGIVGCSKAFGIEPRINDLSILQQVEVQATSFTGVDVQDEGASKLLLEIPNKYTNTIACRGTVAYKVRTSHHIEMRRIHIADQSVFPAGAFGSPVQVQISVPLEAGESLLPYYEGTFQAWCSGWDSAVPLGREICTSREFNPGHILACTTMPPGAAYPLLVKGIYYLGACRCS